MPESQQRGPETQWDIVSSVGITALAVASGRAAETQRSDRLINDPFADTLTQAANPETPLPGQVGASNEPPAFWTDMIGYLGVRSRFFDDFFESACAAGARQAVILASGLDTRSYRLQWPEGFRVFEIDQPLVLEFKDTVLNGEGAQPSCEYHPVAIDLRDDWATALQETGFDPNLPTAWLAEGLIPYLPADAEKQLLETIHKLSAPGSQVAIESISGSRESILDPEIQKMAQEFGVDLQALFNTEPRPDPANTLAEFGWDVYRRPTLQTASELGRELTGFARILSNEQYFLTGKLPN